MPNAIRQSLALEAGSVVEFELVGDSAVMRRVDLIEHLDPEIQALLEHVRKDIATGQRLGLFKDSDMPFTALLAWTMLPDHMKVKALLGDVSL